MMKKLVFAAAVAMFSCASFANNVFVTLDVDKNNAISKKEAAALSSLIGQWESLDADKSGDLSSEEFAKYAEAKTTVMEKVEMEGALPHIK